MEPSLFFQILPSICLLLGVIVGATLVWSRFEHKKLDLVCERDVARVRLKAWKEHWAEDEARYMREIEFERKMREKYEKLINEHVKQLFEEDAPTITRDERLN